MFSKWKRTKSASKKTGWNEVAYVRHGSDTAYINADGGIVLPRNQRTIVVTTKSGEKWEIPVDKNGNVPVAAMWQRFLNVNSGSRDGRKRSVAVDVHTQSATVHDFSKGVTPQELIRSGWWQHPNESDIKGIDDLLTDGKYDLPPAVKDALGQGKRIVLLMDDAEKERVWKVLTDNFTKAELYRACAHGGLIIAEGDPGRGNMGFHRGRQAGADTAIIMLEPGADEDTITHEFIHQLRQEDCRRGGLVATPFPRDTDYKLRPGWGNNKSARNLEEACTVAEAAARTRKQTKKVSGYYQSIPGKSPSEYQDNYQHDRKVMTGDPEKPLKGARALKKMETSYQDTYISHLKRYNGRSADKYLEMRQKAGDLPVAEKPTKKRKKAPVQEPPGMIGVGPVGVTANNRKRRVR